MPAHLSPRQAALRLGVSYPTIKQWLYAGKLKATKTPGGHYRIPESELARLLPLTPTPSPAPNTRHTISGRNQLTGTVTHLRIEGLMAEVKLDISGQTLTAIITAEAARDLGLTIGQPAAALIKATEVMVLRI